MGVWALCSHLNSYTVKVQKGKYQWKSSLKRNKQNITLSTENYYFYEGHILDSNKDPYFNRGVILYD